MAPDTAKFPSVTLCYAAGRAGGTMTGVLSAANEKAVELFVDGKYVSFILIENVTFCTLKTLMSLFHGFSMLCDSIF